MWGEFQLDPVQRSVGSARVPDAGTYTLRLVTAAGHWDYPFEPSEVGHVPGLGAVDRRHFALSVPSPGNLSELVILRGDEVLHRVSAIPGVDLADAVTDLELECVEAEGELQISWNAADFPYLMVAHLGAKRTTLALRCTGGQATVSVDGLSAGGDFELQFGNGLSTRVEVRAR